ncbi:helix-turn-helix transcriptional regulator [Metabacillus sp. KIGAM252]|uniref:Helix-turn-helix transcriptional regulator n=1 Tax=Metabacillus flavus TaxID=2823519 RepID=A0ABS5LBL1_9BACI|nr:helix-turn-helix domain-containing protein [Metabacillus flavus]MBS2968100.1 helix-turn-helix transcriptional regulator [Metabacillus flavus]
MKNVKNGNELLLVLEALSNPYRLKIIETLSGERQYVSQLARALGISRPLLYLHLKKLEEAALIKGEEERGEDGKVMKYFEVLPFGIELNDRMIADAAGTVTLKNKDKGD